MRNLIVIFGDQLNQKISSLHSADKKLDKIMMCELKEEATYVQHHQLKIAFIFSAMRHFCEQLKKAGYDVIYTRLDEPENTHSFNKEVKRIANQFKPKKILVTNPSEWRVLSMVEKWQKLINCPVEILEDDRFYCQGDAFEAFAGKKKQLRMEHFYQKMRKDHHILMNGDKPAGGRWNYDVQNRKKLPKSVKIPQANHFSVNKITQEVIELVNKHFAGHPGSTDNFYFACTDSQAKKVLNDFIKNRLALFGDYQDAMVNREPWLFHSHISFYLNSGLLLPKDVIDAALKAYEQKQVPLNAVEGFIRQILGWREFIRGVYWLKMPAYGDENFFSANKPLPEWFWTGETKMHCLSQCIHNTLDNAYAHHIQRLMVIGNFSLLTMLSPTQVQDWYLSVYADAFEWVEMPNVVGMILHADGGYLASKPYIASGNYINKMSDYCQHCEYDVKEKTGDKACPFNYLYWNFLLNHRDKLKDNPRLAFPYKNIAKMTSTQQKNIRTSAEAFLKNNN